MERLEGTRWPPIESSAAGPDSRYAPAAVASAPPRRFGRCALNRLSPWTSRSTLRSGGTSFGSRGSEMV